MEPTKRWRELLDYRATEAIAVLGAVPGVRGLIIGGSMGRGDPWPLSDIDLLPIYAIDGEPARQVMQRHAELIDWWAASGRAQTLDVGWLAFTEDEVRQAAQSGPEGAADRMADWRWFHGIDKAFGGRAAADPNQLAQTFLDWTNAVRFAPPVITARVQRWWDQALTAHRLATVAMTDQGQASAHVREAAGALRMVLIEGWGERLGSMGREWTRFERMAEQHGASALAARIADLCDSSPAAVAHRADLAPVWLKERIDLALAARRLVGEQVTPEQNARDQLLAFATHVVRRRSDLTGPWVGGASIPALRTAMVDVEAIIATLRPNEAVPGA